MAKKKSRKKKNTALTAIILILLIALGLLVANSLLNGELLKNIKTAEEKKSAQIKTIKKEEAKEIDAEKGTKVEDKDKEVFTKKDDDNKFVIVDKTVDDTKTTTEPIERSEKQREALAIEVVKKEWFDGEIPSEMNVYFSIVTKKSENVYIVEVRDNETTRMKSRYEVNVAKKEIVNIF